MVELDGIEYTVSSPSENTASLLNRINQYCTDNEIKNSRGEIINIEASWANPLYLILYAFGFVASVIQKLVYSAGCALNLSSASERNLINLGTMAGIKRGGPTKTTIPVVIYGSVNAENEIEITPSLSVTIKVDSSSVIFHPAYSMTVGAGDARPCLLVAESYGAYSIDENAVSSFDDPLEGLDHISSEASIPGTDQESILNYRARLQRRSSSSNHIDRAIDAISELEGVAMCNIYYNYNASTPVIINNIEIPARQALLVVQGYSDKIAETFYGNLICATAGDDQAGIIKQAYVTRASQHLSVNILPPIQLPLYIRVYLKGTPTEEMQNQMRNAIMSLAGTVKIAQTVSVSDVLEIVKEKLPSYKLETADISKDGIDYSYIVKPTSIELPTFNANRINFITVLEE